MSYLLFETINNAAEDKSNIILESVLLFNNVKDKLSIEITPQLIEKMANSLNSVHLFVYHGQEIHLVLFTINTDLSINIFAEAIINQHTLPLDLDILKTQFHTAMTNLLQVKEHVNIKLTIIVSNTADLWVRPAPFLPLTDFLLTLPFSLYTHITYNYDIGCYVPNVSSSLPNLLSIIQILSNRCAELLTMVNTISDDENAENSWHLMKATNQLLRYVEAVHNIHEPIEPINTEVSRLMEDYDLALQEHM